MPYNLLVYKNLLHTLGHWGHFFIAGHGARLKPGFMNYLRNRVAEMLQALSGLGKAAAPGKAGERSMEEMLGSNPVFA